MCKRFAQVCAVALLMMIIIIMVVNVHTSIHMLAREFSMSVIGAIPSWGATNAENAKNCLAGQLTLMAFAEV